VLCGTSWWGRLAAIGGRVIRREVVSLQIAYKCLAPGAEPTDDALSKAELVGIRQVEDCEELPRQEVGEVIQVPDHRRGDEERSFKVVMVSATPTITGFFGEPSAMIDNLNIYVTDVE
jgi:hypothetical protein